MRILFAQAQIGKVVEIFDCLAVGEDVSTTSLNDAWYWQDSYRELSSFDQTLSRLGRQVAGSSNALPR